MFPLKQLYISGFSAKISKNFNKILCSSISTFYVAVKRPMSTQDYLNNCVSTPVPTLSPRLSVRSKEDCFSFFYHIWKCDLDGLKIYFVFPHLEALCEICLQLA